MSFFSYCIVALKETHFFLLSSFFDFHEISICSKQSWGISSSILPFQWCFLLAIWIQYNFMHSIWFVLTYYSSFYWWVFFLFFYWNYKFKLFVDCFVERPKAWAFNLMLVADPGVVSVACKSTVVLYTCFFYYCWQLEKGLIFNLRFSVLSMILIVGNEWIPAI